MDEATLLLDFEIVAGAAGLLLLIMIYLFYFRYPVNKELEK